MSKCIYCQRPRSEHKNPEGIEMLDEDPFQGRCCIGFTTREDLDKPNVFGMLSVGSSLDEARALVSSAARDLTRLANDLAVARCVNVLRDIASQLEAISNTVGPKLREVVKQSGLVDFDED